MKVNDEKLRSVEDVRAECSQKVVEIKIAEGIERMKLEAQNKVLREALSGLLGKIEDGSLIRSIDRDHESDWSLRALKLVQAIQAAQRAVERAGDVG